MKGDANKVDPDSIIADADSIKDETDSIKASADSIKTSANLIKAEITPPNKDSAIPKEEITSSKGSAKKIITPDKDSDSAYRNNSNGVSAENKVRDPTDISNCDNSNGVSAEKNVRDPTDIFNCEDTEKKLADLNQENCTSYKSAGDPDDREHADQDKKIDTDKEDKDSSELHEEVTVLEKKMNTVKNCTEGEDLSMGSSDLMTTTKGDYNITKKEIGADNDCTEEIDPDVHPNEDSTDFDVEKCTKETDHADLVKEEDDTEMDVDKDCEATDLNPPDAKKVKL